MLDEWARSFELAAAYGAKLIQIDSVCGHLKPTQDEAFAAALNAARAGSVAALLGGVRFKYQPIRSGRTQAEDLLLGAQRCDAVVCTGEGTGIATPFEKVRDFRRTLGDFPMIVGAGVTLGTAAETFREADGAIVGSWFKDDHVDFGEVNEDYVRAFMQEKRANEKKRE